jgi:hypothetical protein
MYEQALLMGYASAALIIAIIGYDIYAMRHKRLLAIRQKALDDAANALRGVAHAAELSDDALSRDRQSEHIVALRNEARSRARYLGRAAQIVSSIPVDRL